MEETCQKCGHTRYAGDLFDGGCDDCCDWMVAKLAELTAERDKANWEAERSAAECLEWREKAKAWLASPEAGKRLDGYRELSARLEAVTAERGALIERERECREAWANRHGGIDGVFMSVKLSAYNILNRNLGE